MLTRKEAELNRSRIAANAVLEVLDVLRGYGLLKEPVNDGILGRAIADAVQRVEHRIPLEV